MLVHFNKSVRFTCSPSWMAALILAVMLAVPVTAVQGQVEILRVDIENGDPDGDGSGWGSDAFRFLQDALVAAEALLAPPSEIEAVEVWVAAAFDGNDDPIPYRPDQSKDHDWCDDEAEPGPDCCPPFGTCDREASFHMQNNVRILGGFPPDPHTWNNGQGATIDDRDPAAFETILSGDLEEDDDVTIFDNGNLACETRNNTPQPHGGSPRGWMTADSQASSYPSPQIASDNFAEHFNRRDHRDDDPVATLIAGAHVNATAAIDGFTIRSSRDHAFIVDGDHPRVANCVFITQSPHAAVIVRGTSTVVFQHCLFESPTDELIQADDGATVYCVE